MKAKCYLFAFLLTVLQGCAQSNGIVEYSSNADNRINYLPFGIPLLLGGHGSSVPLTQHISVTAKHVATWHPQLVIALHPDCDLALIRENNVGKQLASLGKVFGNQSVTTIGTDTIGQTLTSTGIYYRDAYLSGHELFENCPVSITDAPIQSGMSGGGVYNQDDELVGIISAMADNIEYMDGSELRAERFSLFIPLLFSQDWLVHHIENFYATHSHLELTTQIAQSVSFNHNADLQNTYHE